jgi:hypothetical protein
MQFGLPHFLIAIIFWCVCRHPIDPMAINLLCCIHNNEHTRTHDAIRNTFATITWDVSFHMGWKQLHSFLKSRSTPFCWWINIVLTKDDIHTLANIVIFDPTRVDLFLRSCAIQGFSAFDVVQTKELNYHNWYPTNQFLFLAIEIFGFLQK